MKTNLSPDIRRYLLIEAILFLFILYIVLAGGTFNGLLQPALVQINLGLLILLGLCWLLSAFIRRREFVLSPLLLPAGLFLAANAIAAAASVDPRRSLILLVEMASIALIFALLTDFLRRPGMIDLLLKCLIFASIPVVIFCFIQLYLFYSQWLNSCGWGGTIPTLRISVFLGHPNFMAAFLNMTLALVLARAIPAPGKRWQIGWLIYAAVLLVLIFFTSSRGGWMGTAALLGIGALLFAIDRREKLTRIFRQIWHSKWRIGMITAGVLVLAIALTAGGVLIQWQMRHSTHASSGLNPNSRTYIWSVAWQAIKNDPLTGNGPFTFGTEFMDTYSTPPDMILAHAHNAYINTAAESGLLGLGTLIFGLVVLIRCVRKRWKMESGSLRTELIAVIAALTGLAVHSLFDTPTHLPALAIIAAALTAALTAPLARPLAAPRRAWGGMLVFWLVCAGSAGWLYTAAQPAWKAQEAAMESNWSAAANWMDEAIRRDPGMALNYFQSGYAHGMIALQSTPPDAVELETAIQTYRSGIQLEPVMAINYANLALLEAASGNMPQAIADMKTASEQAKDMAPFHLTLGAMLEAAGETEAAQDAFLMGLSLSPVDADTSPYWDATPLRVSVREAYRTTGHQRTLDIPAAMTRCQAEFFPPAALYGYETWLALGDQLLAAGDTTGAQNAYESGLRSLQMLEPVGMDAYQFGGYGAYVFHRLTFTPEILPGLVTPRLNARILTSLENLSVLYRQSGNESGVKALQDWLETVIPFASSSLPLQLQP